MAAITLTSLVCNNTVNPVRDGIILRINGAKIATFDFVDLEVQPLAFAASNNDSIELIVKINATNAFKSIGTRHANSSLSPIPFSFGLGNYALHYT